MVAPPMLDKEIKQRRLPAVWRRHIARALAACAASVLATLAAAWLLAPSPATARAHQAIVRETVPVSGPPGARATPIVDELRSREHLGAVLRAIGAVSRADIDPPSVDPEDAWVEHVHQRLRITADTAPLTRRRVVTIRFLGGDSFPAAAAPVNKLADDYLAALRAQVELEAQRELDAAQAAAAEAQVELVSARAAHDAWLEERLGVKNMVRAAEPAVPDVLDDELAESPPDNDPNRELSELLARRDALLERLTPEHPDVKALDLLITVARRQTEQLGPLPTRQHRPSKNVVDSTRLVPPSQVRRPPFSEWSIAWDAGTDAQWKNLRRIVAAAESRRAELALEESRASEALAAVRTAELAQVTPAATAVAAEPARARWKNLFVVVTFGLLAAWGATVGWPTSPLTAQAYAPVAGPSLAMIDEAEFEAEFGLPLVGVVEMELIQHEP